MVLPQLAHNLSPSLVFCVNTTKDDWNLILVCAGLRSGGGLWRWFRGPSPLQLKHSSTA